MPFCDWFSGFINLDIDTLHDGRIMYLKTDGTIEYEIYKPLQVSGSYDDKVSIQSCLIPSNKESSLNEFTEENWRVKISGNPTKFLQGHNVYGHSDMIGVIRDFIKAVLQKVDIDEFTIARVLRDPVRVTRLDITQSYQLDRPADVTDWLRHASQYMTGKNQKVDTDKTLYVGKHSRRVSIKIYEKASEMLCHKSTFNLSEDAFLALHKTASCLLRFEVTLRGKKLDDIGFSSLHKLENSIMENQYNLQLDKMNLPDNMDIQDDDINMLPPKYIGVYKLWLDGVDIKLLMSRAQYYRYRKFFLSGFNIDLSMPPRELPKKSNVVPLWRYIVAGDRVFNPCPDDEYLYVPTSSKA